MFVHKVTINFIPFIWYSYSLCWTRQTLTKKFINNWIWYENEQKTQGKQNVLDKKNCVLEDNNIFLFVCSTVGRNPSVGSGQLKLKTNLKREKENLLHVCLSTSFNYCFMKMRLCDMKDKSLPDFSRNSESELNRPLPLTSVLSHFKTRA